MSQDKTDVRINPHEVFAKETQLANIYLRDGAFYTAADLLRKLADRIDAHIDDVNTEFGLATRADLERMRG